MNAVQIYFQKHKKSIHLFIVRTLCTLHSYSMSEVFTNTAAIIYIAIIIIKIYLNYL